MFSYLFGLGIGLSCLLYLILCLIIQKKENKMRRIGVILLLGLIVTLVSVTVIGGFEGMPYGVLGLGIMLGGLLIGIVQPYPLLQKVVISSVIVIVVGWTFYLISGYYMEKDVSYRIIDENELNQQDVYSQEIQRYIKSLESTPSIKGYKLVQLSDGKGIVLSLGNKMAGNSINVVSVKEKAQKMEIKVKTVSNKLKKKNPFIVIGLESFPNELQIVDTDGSVYTEITTKK